MDYVEVDSRALCEAAQPGRTDWPEVMNRAVSLESDAVVEVDRLGCMLYRPEDHPEATKEHIFFSIYARVECDGIRRAEAVADFGTLQDLYSEVKRLRSQYPDLPVIMNV